jgi:hypothetical protein
MNNHWLGTLPWYFLLCISSSTLSIQFFILMQHLECTVDCCTLVKHNTYTGYCFLPRAASQRNVLLHIFCVQWTRRQLRFWWMSTVASFPNPYFSEDSVFLESNLHSLNLSLRATVQSMTNFSIGNRKSQYSEALKVMLPLDYHSLACDQPVSPLIAFEVLQGPFERFVD